MKIFYEKLYNFRVQCISDDLFQFVVNLETPNLTAEQKIYSDEPIS